MKKLNVINSISKALLTFTASGLFLFAANTLSSQCYWASYEPKISDALKKSLAEKQL